MVTPIKLSNVGTSAVYEFVGKSTDEKPVSTNGSKFIEMDTGKEFYFDGDEKGWFEKADKYLDAIVTLAEVKPNEIEVSKDETWEDPEPKTNVIVDRISALLSVKSIITLAFVFTYLAMVLKGIEVPDLFNNILTMIVSFFFGYQFKKAAKE